jgi:hypothetical protein
MPERVTRKRAASTAIAPPIKPPLAPSHLEPCTRHKSIRSILAKHDKLQKTGWCFPDVLPDDESTVELEQPEAALDELSEDELDEDLEDELGIEESQDVPSTTPGDDGGIRSARDIVFSGEREAADAMLQLNRAPGRVSLMIFQVRTANRLNRPHLRGVNQIVNLESHRRSWRLSRRLKVEN